ncbi:MAG: hypothetical protein IPI85_15645 [Dehalococcoidia bacterium]|nr:hypothetical protein [Dehalococcoidia bacterium]
MGHQARRRTRQDPVRRCRRRHGPRLLRHRPRRPCGLRLHHRGHSREARTQAAGARRPRQSREARSHLRFQHLGFVIEEVARDVSEARKKLFIGMHFSNPVTTMRMCEVIYTPQSAQDTIDAGVKLGEAGGKAVSLVKDTPGTYGFLLNRIFGAAAREARAIAEQGIATKEDIDKAMITGRNWPSGFFGARGGIGKEW